MAAILDASAFVLQAMHKGGVPMEQKNCPARWLPFKISIKDKKKCGIKNVYALCTVCCK
jgi:hypothetical protein